MRNDILLDDDFDLQEDGDDWAEGDTTDSDAELITMAAKGENREFPFAGFGAINYIRKRISKEQFINNLLQELDNDGITAKVIMGDTIGDIQIQVQ